MILLKYKIKVVYHSQMGKDTNLVERQTFSSDLRVREPSLSVCLSVSLSLSLSLSLSSLLKWVFLKWSHAVDVLIEPGVSL